MLSRSVSNIICSVIFGSRFDYDDERLLTIIRLINDNFQIMSTPWGEVRRPSWRGYRGWGSSWDIGETAGGEGVRLTLSGPALSRLAPPRLA